MDEIPKALRRLHEVFRDRGPMSLSFCYPNAKPIPAIYVSRVETTARITGSPTAKPHPLRLGRALGRIMAHELGHRFLSREHRRSGIMRRGLLKSDLVESDRDGLHFTEEQVPALLSAAAETPDQIVRISRAVMK